MRNSQKRKVVIMEEQNSGPENEVDTSDTSVLLDETLLNI